ncbi:MAG: hypothetical protein LBI39_04195, partial [Puniceicoccales bacterium]|nr:hypothetical protein [Puniceicoccales bacterium]
MLSPQTLPENGVAKRPSVGGVVSELIGAHIIASGVLVAMEGMGDGQHLKLAGTKDVMVAIGGAVAMRDTTIGRILCVLIWIFTLSIVGIVICARMKALFRNQELGKQFALFILQKHGLGSAEKQLDDARKRNEDENCVLVPMVVDEDDGDDETFSPQLAAQSQWQIPPQAFQ